MVQGTNGRVRERKVVYRKKEITTYDTLQGEREKRGERRSRVTRFDSEREIGEGKMGENGRRRMALCEIFTTGRILLQDWLRLEFFGECGVVTSWTIYWALDT